MLSSYRCQNTKQEAGLLRLRRKLSLEQNLFTLKSRQQGQQFGQQEQKRAEHTRRQGGRMLVQRSVVESLLRTPPGCGRKSRHSWTIQRAHHDNFHRIFWAASTFSSSVELKGQGPLLGVAGRRAYRTDGDLNADINIRVIGTRTDLEPSKP